MNHCHASLSILKQGQNRLDLLVVIPTPHSEFSAVAHTSQWFLCLSVGTLPSSWSGDSALQTIIVAQNKLTGTLPASWSQLGKLVNLDVRSNDLSGPVPDSWRGFAAPGVLPTSGMTSLTTL